MLPMRKLLTILVIFATALAYAQPVDSVLLVNSGDDASTDVHVRAIGKKWSLLWDVVDTANYREAQVQSAVSKSFDPVYGHTSRLTLKKVVDGRVDASQTFNINHHSPEFSVRLQSWPSGLRILAGDGKRVIADERAKLQTYEGDSATRVILRQTKSCQLRRVIINQQKRVPASFCHLTADGLIEHLKTSTDSIEGIWQYLDRDVPAPTVQFAQTNNLAIVHNPQTGDYDIVLTKLPSSYANLWRPMQIKGHLKPTIFVNHFDAEWINGDRTAVYDREVSATIEQNAILTFYFPLLKSQVRYRRVKLH